MIQKYSLYTFITLLLISQVASASAPRDPYQYFFEQNLGDLTEELETAIDDGKKGIFVFFEMDECPFCHRMKKTVLNQVDIQNFFKKNFHSISIDIEGDLEMVDFEGNEMTQKKFASNNRVRATPVMAFYDLQGKQVVRYTGAASGSEEFLWFAEYFLQGVYKMKDKNGRNIRFGKYKRLKKKEKSKQQKSNN